MRRRRGAVRQGIVGLVSSPTHDHGPALQQLADEVAGLRRSLEALVAENRELRARLDHSETARRDLVAQTEHIVELLADSRRELRALQAKGS